MRFYMLCVDNARSNLTPPRRYDDPSTKIWSFYLEQAEKENARMTESWKSDMDAILIFAGLFSASVTAFIIESYRDLMPDNSDTTVILLAHIYHELSNNATLTTIPSVANALDANSFVPSTSSLTCNILWFSSLSLSLTAALSATLVQQWSRDYLQATVDREIPYQRARISTYLYEGLTKFHMKSLVTTIPMLLHASLLLFFAGLVLFLQPVNPGISYLVCGLLLITAILYILISILPIFYFDCPYGSPLTKIWWRILCSLQLIVRENSQGGTSPVPSDCSLAKVREWEATNISYDRDERDFRAVCWTLEYSPDDSTLELFASIIPDVVAGIDYSAKLLCRRLLDRDDPSMRLGFRLTQLLSSCTTDSTWAKRRCVTTLSAIWSLTMMSLPIPNTPYRQPQLSVEPFVTREMLRFDEHTLRFIELIQKHIPDASSYSLSTATVIARSLLDMLSDHILHLETELFSYTRTKTLPERYQKLVLRARHGQNTLRQGHPRMMLDRIDKEAWDMQQMLNVEQRSMISASAYVSLDSLFRHLQDIVVVVLIGDQEEIPSYMEEILNRLNDFQTLLQQAGFLLILEFIEHSLRGPTLSHEPFNTTRRLYLRLNLDSPLQSFSLRSQNRLVCYLEDALDYHNSRPNTVRLPEGMINLLLGLVKGLTDPECVSKAKGIVLAYTKVCVSMSNLEAAREALGILDMALPEDIRPPEALDIFSEHVYSNTKLVRSDSVDTMVSIPPRQGC
ncbi:hypothetical protein J3R30DRAFT_3816411 [Lentinula aciculospora]|uniref:DUF6535 domain-containing protein n=1 Tax=Lentinula aciculospora TaxID=153920 RepID=A0A9W9AN96_9AGAR|nr:hypothetical protein J3R30DRAFT_3816411 [Lentinula aciculospora]